MKALLITVAAAPSVGSHALRINAIVESLHSADNAVVLVTCRWPEAMYDASDLYLRLSKFSQVKKARGGALRAFADFARSRRSITQRASRLRLSQAMFRALKGQSRRFLIPDTFMTWIPRAIWLALRSLGDWDQVVVISSGAPFSPHIVAAFVSWIRRAPLILDYGDPWVYEPGRPKRGLRLMVERILERAVLRRASSICVTTEETAELYRTKYSDVPVPIHVVPMGYDKSDYLNPSCSIAPRGPFIRCVYAGRMNDEYRSFSGVKALIEDVELNSLPLRFEFYGADHARALVALDRFVLNGLVNVCDNLDHPEYINLLVNADVIIIFGNNNYIQIPGKIAHCVASGRPILYFPNVVDIDSDPSLRLLRQTVCTGLFVFNDDFDVLDLINFIQRGDQVTYWPDRLNSLEWKTIGGRFVKIVESSVRTP